MTHNISGYFIFLRIFLLGCIKTFTNFRWKFYVFLYVIAFDIRVILLSRWRRENAKKVSEMSRNVTDEEKAAISHHGFFKVVIRFCFKCSFYLKCILWCLIDIPLSTNLFSKFFQPGHSIPTSLPPPTLAIKFWENFLLTQGFKIYTHFVQMKIKKILLKKSKKSFKFRVICQFPRLFQPSR